MEKIKWEQIGENSQKYRGVVNGLHLFMIYPLFAGTGFQVTCTLVFKGIVLDRRVIERLGDKDGITEGTLLEAMNTAGNLLHFLLSNLGD